MEAEDIYNLSGNLREVSNYIVSAETETETGTACLQTYIKQLTQMASLKGWPNCQAVLSQFLSSDFETLWWSFLISGFSSWQSLAFCQTFLDPPSRTGTNPFYYINWGMGPSVKHFWGVQEWSYVVPEGPKEEFIFKIGVWPAAYVFLLLILPNSQRLCSYAMRDKSTTDIIFSFDGTYFNRVLSDCKQLFRKCLAWLPSAMFENAQ